MATSLAQQLKKLAVPQSSFVIEEKRRVSLLFDPKEAATFDRDVFYNLGVHGLKELIKLNPKFAHFEKTLFDVASKGLQRSVAKKDVNKKLDHEILKFMCYLSPYFLLNSSHKALEWLIQRFMIHRYNVDQFMMLILPYHSTNMFVRVLQLFKIKDSNNRWHWLYPLQNAGVPLSKKTLLNHCASNNWFLSYMCQIPVTHLKVCDEDSKALHTVCTFCCTTIVGMLMQSKEVSEVQVTHTLKLIIETMHSQHIEFSCMSVIIAAELVRSVKLSTKILNVLVHKLSKFPHKSFQTESVVVIALIYLNQQETLTGVPEKALVNFAQSKTFIGSLQKIIDGGGRVTYLLIAVIKETTLNILQFKHNKLLQAFLDYLISTIKFDDYTAKRVISVVVESFIIQECTESSFEGQMDVDDTSEKKKFSVLQWYSSFVRSLELQFPVAFDYVVEKALESTRDEKQHKNLLELLGFVPKINLKVSERNIFEKLHHPNLSLRIEAIRYLITKIDKLQEEDGEFVRNILRQRLQDDSFLIVEAVLECPCTTLASLVGEEFFVKQMIQISARYWHMPKVPLSLKKKVISYLCSEVSMKTNERAVWIASLPYLLPRTDSDLEFAVNILKSKYCFNEKFFLAIEEGISKKKTYGADLFCSVVAELMENDKLTPSVSSLMELMNEIPIFKSEIVFKFIFVVLLTTAINRENIEMKWKIMDEIMELYSSENVNYVKCDSLLAPGCMKACIQEAYEKKLPIEGLLHSLLYLTSSMKLSETVTCQHWWRISSENKDHRTNSLLFFIRIFELLVVGCMNENSEEQVRVAYVNILKRFFKTSFPNLSGQLGFLSNMWVAHEFGESYKQIVSFELQLRSLLLARSLIMKTNESLSWTMNIREESIIPPLLISLSCPVAPVRVAALECLIAITHKVGKSFHQKGYHCLLTLLLDYEEELRMDANQISVILYKLLSPDPDVQIAIIKPEENQLTTVMNALFDCVFCERTPWHIRAALLKILSYVNSKDIMKKLAPLGSIILINAVSNNNRLDVYQSVILCNILSRFDRTMYDLPVNDIVLWKFFQTALLDFKSLVHDGKRISCPSVIAMKQITRDFYGAWSQCQSDILKILVYIAAESESPQVISTVGHVIKKIVLNCQHVVIELVKMRDAASVEVISPGMNRASNRSVHPSGEILKTVAWREGTTLLELIQNKKKLNNVHLLLPVLFDLLKRCLNFEEQASVEYNKQLILSSILNVCNKLSSVEGQHLKEVSENTVNVELIVQCIRASQNPQTHHHALLVLSRLARMIPEQVLHNIMAIFTFMGSSILRQDDSYSFQIITKVVDSVVPIVVKARTDEVNPVEMYDPVAEVLRVFVDALLDIPEHRQIPLFHKLVTILGVDNFLWLLMSLVIESEVKHKTSLNQDKRRSSSDQMKHKTVSDHLREGVLPVRFEFMMNLSLKFHPSVVIQNSIKLMEYLMTLPIEKEQKDVQSKKEYDIKGVTKLFNIANSSRSDFHHFKYAIIIFLSSVIGNSDFINQVAALTNQEFKIMEPLYTYLIECVLLHIQTSVQACEASAGKPTAKYWKCMLGQSYDLLNKVNALLLSDMFLRVILSLIDSPIPTIARKAMELFNARLQNEEFFSSCKTEDILIYITPLLKIIHSVDQLCSAEEQLSQQTAFASMKLLARLLCAEHQQAFQKVWNSLVPLFKKNAFQGNILASALLCGAELCSCLHAHSLNNLPNFMETILKIFKQERNTDNPDVMLLAIVTAVYKIVERLANFLTPYLTQLLFEVSCLSAKLSQEPQTQKIIPIVTKLELIKQKLASEVPLRILVSVVNTTYSNLLREKKYRSIEPLMGVLANSFADVTSSDFNHLQSELSSFFLSALQFRGDNANGKCDIETVNLVEGNVVKALVALVLKLSESSFRPLYYNLFHWATAVNVQKERLITFYSVSHSIAECLKGLFVLFAGHFIQNAAMLLQEVNLSKSKTLLYGHGEAAKDTSLLLLDAILKTLHTVFLYDSAHFLNRERFDILMQPLVDQLENTLGGLEAYKVRTKSLLSPCIVQFAVVTADDSLWKQLNYQILLKTRNSNPVIRHMAVETVGGIAQKLGDDFLPQLPETIPFLAELMEDEEEGVEAACVRVVQEMEEVLGEPLKKYF